MALKKRGLGKGLGDLGLNELLGNRQETVAVTASTEPAIPALAATASSKIGEYTKLPLDQLHPGRYQPRKQMAQDALHELADSIRSQGVIQPVVVRQDTRGYEIIAGERRWRAAKIAELTEIPVIIRDIPDEAAIAMSLIENIQRRDLNAIEEAEALQRLMHEFEMTHQEVADAVGKSRTAITNALRLLKLNPEVRSLVEQGLMEMGHARALLALEGLQQTDAANQVVARLLSVRETEQLVRDLLEPNKPRSSSPVSQDPNIRSLQNRLSEQLGAKVIIQHANNSGKGKLVIYYNSNDELDGVLDHIK